MNCSRPGPISGHPVQVAKAAILERMFEHMEATLADRVFESKQSEKGHGVLRSLYGRSRMEEREVQILQGIWSRIDWYLRMKGKGG